MTETEPPPVNASKELHETNEFLSRVAWLYYENAMTQSEVADHLRVTRLRVNRAIASARERGLVRIDIASPFAAAQDLQSELVQQFGLSAAYVGLASRTNYDPHHAVGAALAFHLDNALDQGAIGSIGVSWGRTLETAIRRLRKRALPDLEIVSMIGGTARGASFNAFGVAAGFAQKLGAQYSLFAAPIYCDSAEIAASLLASPLFVGQVARTRAVDLAVLVAGDLSERSFMIRDGVPADVAVSELEAAGAVGDVLGRFVDAEGRPIDHELNDRAIGLSLSDLKRLSNVALAAAGPHKAAIIRAALRAGYAQTLITDDLTAETLLAE